jgi:hypothetical protein
MVGKVTLIPKNRKPKFLQTLRQAPVDINGLIFWMPFHSQEAEDEIGEDKKSPYLIYLF